MKKLLWTVLVLCTGLAIPMMAMAAPLLEENFDYTAGDNITSHGWVAHSGTGTQPITVSSGGLTYSGYPGSGVGNAALLDNTGEDDNKGYASQNSGSIYYSFLINATTPTLGYFIMLNQNATVFGARAFIQPSGAGMQLGISNTSTAPTSWSSVLSLSTTYLVVVRLDLPSGYAYMWVNPVGCTEPTADLTSLTTVTAFTAVGVALRQYGATQNFLVDGIRVGLTWAEVVCGSDGSCCYNDGTCAVTTEPNCSGTWTAAGVCDPNPCPQPGECCYADGSCAVTFEAGCPGVWTLGGTCTPNPCPQPGSCCQHSGACTVTFEAACTDPGAVWTLGGICDPNTCPLPTGACCTQGVCTVTEQAACAGETWTMDGICTPNPCTLPTGSCCAPDGSCTVTLQAGCDAPSTWTLAGVCVPNTCPLPNGSCCYADGTCAVTLQAACTGTWTMFGVCDPNTCVQPDGSCCHPDGSCTVAKLADCALPGVWTMFGICDPNTCAQPDGSCCDIYGACTVTQQVACLAPSVWTMFGVCDPNTCPPETGACCLPDGTCLTGLPGDCLGVGVYQGAGTACSPNPCPAPWKTVCEVAADDANGLALLVGKRVTVTGIALCNGDTWSKAPTNPAVREFQITDGNCCIDIFGGTSTPTVATGDSVVIVGTVANYAGKTEVTTPDLTVTVISSGHAVTPGLTTTGNLAAAGEPFESCLFTINCVSIISGTWPTTRVDANITINDGTGNVVMRLDKDTDCWTIPAPTGPFTVTGIGDQYDTTSPFTVGYQLKPRGPFDIGAICASGACCKPDGSCSVMSPSACALVGVYQGDGTTCPPNPDCPPPVGACCFHDGHCEMLAQVDCTGLWLTYGSVCVPNPCEQPVGSCCISGACYIMEQATCDASGGTDWTIDGVCDPNPCGPSGVETGELDSVLGVRARPNPFTTSVALRIAGPKGSAARVLVFDPAGRLVRTAWDGTLNGRAINVTWDGRDDSGRATPAGIYMIRLTSASGDATGRVVKMQ